MLIKNILLVAFGGGLGSVSRFLCQKYIYEAHPQAFPLGTFLVNISGCFLIGIFSGLADRANLLAPDWRLMLTTGFCGGFTTFSSFAYENIALMKGGYFGYFALYTAGSVALGLLATWLGLALVKAF